MDSGVVKEEAVEGAVDAVVEIVHEGRRAALSGVSVTSSVLRVRVVGVDICVVCRVVYKEIYSKRF